MKRIIQTLVLILNITNIYSQTISIHGRAFDNESDTVYYTLNDKFKKNQFLVLSNDSCYSLKISLDKVIKNNITTIAFTNDKGYKLKDRNSCKHVINIGIAVRNKIYNIYSDLLLLENCKVETRDNIKFLESALLGTFKVDNDPAIKEVIIEDAYLCTMVYKEPNENNMTGINGKWKYETKDGESLHILFHLQTNEELHTCKVKEQNCRFEFVYKNNVTTLRLIR